ncbi:MAG: hypothetical protein IT342_05415 [Candidatus Melainabacteria bacterium]|nr:hypothetical protein [Candidatus Melainabacteria bacterium]
MPSDFCLMHVGYWVTDLAALSCLGAGLAAIVLTLLPGKRLTGKTEASDPSAFIDPGAGETARYRLAYKDLVTVKNSGLDATQVSGVKAPEPLADGDASSVHSAGDLALTMFDRGVLGVGPGAMSQEATKQISKTRIESKPKNDSKTKLEPKPKIDNKTRVEPKAKIDPKKKPDLKKTDPKKTDAKKADGKPSIETSMAVRKITYGHKRPDLMASNANAEEKSEEDAPRSLEPSYFTEDESSDFSQSPDGLAAFPAQAIEAPGFSMPAGQPPGGPTPTGQPHALKMPPRQPVSFEMPADQLPGFPIPSNQITSVPAPSSQTPGFPAPSSQAPVFRASSSRLPAFPAPANEAEVVPAAFYEVAGSEETEDQIPAPPVQIDPKKDPKKVGRSTLIEPKSNLKGESEPKGKDEPPPLEYFK